MRVRSFELRLLGAALTVLWTLTAGLVLLGYRPGGQIDLLVGLAATTPVAIAAVGLIWPPAARGDHVFAATVWLGLVATLLLIPSIGGVIGQLVSRGAQTLLPSIEAAYPWLLALAGTSLFAGLGLARRLMGPTSPRRRRFVAALGLAVILTAASGSVFTGAALINEVSLRDKPAISSRFGPTDPGLVPPTCDGRMTAARSARLDLSMSADLDTRPIGSFQLAGLRAGRDVRWTANVASDIALGRVGAARIGNQAWLLGGRGPWTATPPAEIDPLTVDLNAIDTALAPGLRAAAEDRGIEFVGGARARHCRIAIDGPTFDASFPEASWLVGNKDLHRWRGELDYWVFADAEIGQVGVTVNGDATGLSDTALQATIRLTLTAVDRDSPLTVTPPA